MLILDSFQGNRSDWRRSYDQDKYHVADGRLEPCNIENLKSHSSRPASDQIEIELSVSCDKYLASYYSHQPDSFS